MADNPLKLLSPIRIGPMTVRNRIVMPAMNTSYATTDGEVTDRLVGFYRARARGGVRMMGSLMGSGLEISSSPSCLYCTVMRY